MSPGPIFTRLFFYHVMAVVRTVCGISVVAIIVFRYAVVMLCVVVHMELFHRGSVVLLPTKLDHAPG